jgi:hypothetical protein
MNTLLIDAAETSSEVRLTRRISADRVIRAAVHVVCWIPFITAAANSWRGPWRAIGDGARSALVSWDTLGGTIPLVGQPNELPHTPHDLGPLQFWLLTIPVHVDPARGVFWGAALLVMLAASLTVEAGYSVRGEIGGLLAAGVVIALVLWYPSFAAYPFDNPNYGTMFFVAALFACLAVLSGHRKWWPVLVVTASITAQAYLTFAAASVVLVLIALGTGLADEFRAKGRYSWLIAGLIAGAACWIAPLDQQFTSPAGQGNMSLLLHQSGGRHVGVTFAMKVLSSLAGPSPLWWKPNFNLLPHLYQVLSSKSATSGLVLLAITAASLVVAHFWLRSRELVGLAVISLLVSVISVATLSRIPARSTVFGEVHRPPDVPLIYILFVAVVIAWLTAICVTVAAVLKLISDRRGRAGATGERAPEGHQRARQYMIPMPVRVTAALLVVTTVLLNAAQQVTDYTGAGTNPLRVSAALATIERSSPSQSAIALSVSSTLRSDRYQLLQGMCWALTGNGYRPDTYQAATKGSRRIGSLPEVVLLIRGDRMTVTTRRTHRNTRAKWRSCSGV